MIRVVLAGSDADARELRDAGVEVVFLDGQASARQVAATAVQEDADAVISTDDAVAGELAALGAPDIPALTPVRGADLAELVRTSVAHDR